MLSAISQKLRALAINLALDTLPAIKTLGIPRNALRDVFTSRVTTSVVGNVRTKRSIERMATEVFNPLGLASPFVAQGKILIQDLWTMGIGYDDPVTQKIAVRAQ